MPCSRSNPTWPVPLLAAAALFVLLASSAGAGCGYTEIREQCPSCAVVSRHVPSTTLPPGTRTLFLIVPGLLGFGWEWDEPLARLRGVPASSIAAFDWRPSSPAARVGRDLATAVNRILREGPELRQIVVLGHSAGGLVTAVAGAAIEVPAGRTVHIVNIGTPYAGMHTMPAEDPKEAWNAPVALAIGGTFTRYPALAPGVTLESWVTPYPGDPVMKPRFGPHPDDPRVGPTGPRFPAPPGTDHNRFVAHVIDEVAKRVTIAAVAREAERVAGQR